MSKFSSARHLFLAAALVTVFQVSLPDRARAAFACKDLYSEYNVSDAYMERLLREDEEQAEYGPIDFSRRYYPPHYYEKYHKRMGLRHKLYAFYRLYVPQFFNVRRFSARRLIGSFLTWDFQKPAPIVLDQEQNYLKSPRFLTVEMIWRGPKEDSVFPWSIVPLNLVEEVTSIPMRLPFTLPSFVRTDATGIRQLIDGSLQRIYQSFASQGPERQILVPIVKEQDQRDLERTTHFEYGILNVRASSKAGRLEIDEVAHMQVMTSEGPHQPFHFEEQWGKVPRVPGEVWGEGGRLILKHWKLLNEESQSAVPKEELQTIKFRLMHNAFAWSNNDARLDRFFFQINEPVRKVLLELGWPLDKAQATKKVQVIDGKKTEEWLFSMDRTLMIETEKRMLQNLMHFYFQKFTQNPSGKWLEMSFDANEIKTLVNLGILRASLDKQTAFFDHPSEREWPTLHPSDPSAEPVFFVKPGILDQAGRLSLHFSGEMIQKLLAQWKLPST